jgi:multiple sugar transport system permease protein
METENAVKMRSRSKAKKALWTCTKWAFLLALSVFFLFPIYALVINSVMPDEQLLGVKSLWPKYFYFGAYTKMLNASYLGYLKNTLFVCLMNILGVCIASSLCAYGLAKVKFKGRNFIFAMIMATVLLPGTVTSIPLYIIYNKLNWTGTLIPLWLPIWFGGGAMNIFLVRQFMKGIPNSYSEAAILDGAGRFHIYWKIVLPLVRPILVYLAVTYFFGCWNDYTGPLMYVNDKVESWTLSLALYKDFGIKSTTSNNNLPNAQMAVGVMMMIPCVILFAFFQKELMEGIAAIGIKG